MVYVSLYQFISVYSSNPTRFQILITLVSTLPGRPVPTWLFASIKKGLSTILHTSFNDSH